MKTNNSAEYCSALYRLCDGSELEISYVELVDDEFEYRRCEVEYLNALNCYLSKIAKKANAISSG